MIATLTGPSFAADIARGLPTALTLACADPQAAEALQTDLTTASLRLYRTTDVTGAELGGALKNVMAIAAGVCDGLGLGHNSRAALLTRGLAEMSRIGEACGAQAATFMGLSGLGDLTLTCTGDLSRNRRLGLALGRGVGLKQAVAEIGQVVESIETVDTVMKLADAHGVELPITALVQKVLHEELTPAEGMVALLSREQKPEYPPLA